MTLRDQLLKATRHQIVELESAIVQLTELAEGGADCGNRLERAHEQLARARRIEAEITG